MPSTPPALPAGFTTHEHGRRQVHLREDLRGDLEALGFLAGDARVEADGTLSGRVPHRRFTLPGSGLEVLWKQCRRGGLAAPLLRDRHFGTRRFLEELTVTEAARQLGLGVAEILAVAIERLPTGARVELLVQVIPDAQDGSDALRAVEGLERREIIEAVADELRCFHGSGFLHGDLNLKNILWTRAGGDLDVLLIDLDPGSHRFLPASRHPEGNLLRLIGSYAKGECRKQHRLTRIEQYRFLFHYFRGDENALRSFWKRATAKRTRQYLKYSRRLPQDRSAHA